MTKQELKEKIIEIIKNNYSENYIFVKTFDIDTCTDEIEALFKEVE